jgi:hypothetical protein
MALRFVNMVVCTTCHPNAPEVADIDLWCSHDETHWGWFYIDVPGRPWFNEPNCFYTWGMLHWHFDQSKGYTV